MKQLRAFICWVIVLCMTLYILPARPALAAINEEPAQTTETYRQLTYTAYDTYIEITGCDASATSIIIPDTIAGLPVTQINSAAFSECSILESVTLPAGVEYWFFSSPFHFSTWFECCPSLREIIVNEDNPHLCSIDGVLFTEDGINLLSYPRAKPDESYVIPDGVLTIQTNAFVGASFLTEVVLPPSLSRIRTNVFAGCSSLQNINVDDSNCSFCDMDGVLFDIDCKTLLCYPAGRSGSYAIPDGITEINDYAFCTSRSLTAVSVPSGVSVIGDGAFLKCSALHDVTIQEGISKIDAYAFSECTAMAKITLPDGVQLENSVFKFCSALADVRLPNNLDTIPSGCFTSCTNLVTIEIPESVSTIGATAFDSCTSLTDISFPDNLVKIGDQAFFGCSSLTGIDLPENLQMIDRMAFGSCDILDDIYIPASVTEIVESAFYACGRLSDVYYGGTEEQWKNIAIGGYNSCLENAVVHYNSTVWDNNGSVVSLVRYLREWDAEKQIAYFGINDFLGCQATAASILPENMEALMGQYVLVTKQWRNSSAIPPDEIISLYPVETRIGTVTASDESAMTIEISGTAYSCIDDLLFLGAVPGNEVLYHIYDGQVAGVEPLQPELGFVSVWDAETGQVSIEDEDGNLATYTISSLVDEAALIALGESRRINVSGVFTADHNHLLYELFLAPGGEYEWDPAVRTERESWYNAHAEYAHSEYFEQDVVQGFTGEIQETLETICDNPIIPIYRTLDSVQKLFHFDTEITDTQEYELLLAQVLFTRTGVQSLETLYQEYVPKSLVKVCDVYMNVLEEAANIDEAKLESFRKALQKFRSIATGAAGYESALNELLLSLDDFGKLNSLDELIKGLEQGKFTFLVNLVSSQIGTTIDTFKDMALYLAAAEAYALTAETFGEMLLKMRRHINIPSNDPRYKPYGAASMLVDDYMIWEELGIEHVNAVNCPVYLSHLATAIEDIYELLEASKDGDADYIGGQLLAGFVDDTGFNAVVAEIEVCWSLLNCIPFVRLAHHIRSLYDGYKFAIDVFTDIDEKEYHGITVQRLYAISYVHYLTVNDLVQNVPTMEEGASEQECYEWATTFDEAVTVYRSILSTAADYAIEYATAVYNVSKEEVWSEPHKHMFPNIHITMGSRIWCLKLEKEILSVPWCHDREATAEIYNRYATSNLVSFTLKCPIKVVVRNEAGTPVAVLSDGSCVTAEGYEHYFHVTETAAGSGVYLKIAVIPDTYTVSVTGTGEGSMDAVVTELPGGEIGKSCYFYDIPIHWDSAVSFPDTNSIVADGVIYSGDPDPHVHTYGQPEFSWSEDSSACNAEFVCTDCGYVTTAACGISIESTATCMQDGTATHTAELYFNLGFYMDSRSFYAPASHRFNSVVTAPNCYDRGFTTYICVFCGKSHIGDKTESQGHTLVDNVCTVCGAVATEHVQLPGFTWAWTHFADGTLEISGNGSMYDYDWEYEPSYASESVNRVIVRPGITRIGNNGFSSAKSDLVGYEMWSRNIRSVELADSVAEIGDCAFWECKSLQTLIIGSGLQTLGYVPFVYCYQLSEIRVSEDNPYFTSIDNVLYSEDGTVLHLFPAIAPRSYVLPMGTGRIKYGAFVNNQTTHELILPPSVNELEDCAFTDAAELDTLIFTGDAPSFQWETMKGADVDAYYPENAEGWEHVIRFSYSGHVTWIPYDPADPPFDTGNPFTDVSYGSWYFEPVLWAVENGITNGTSATTFCPNDPCMRAQVVTFLWRTVGCPEPVSADNPFVDVKESDFFYKAVLWAAEEGITTGTDANHFSPYAVCNRAQVVTFLHRTAGRPGAGSTEHPFADVKPSDFYYDAMLWAVENGITNGMTATTFGPNASCNRAQIVTFLYRTFSDG